MKKIYRKLIVVIAVLYFIFVLVKQEHTLNQYNQEGEQLSQQIQEEQQNKEELARTKENVDSSEFIEQTAREKLDMYYPNEKVYVDSGM